MFEKQRITYRRFVGDIPYPLCLKYLFFIAFLFPCLIFDDLVQDTVEQYPHKLGILRPATNAEG